MRQRIQLTLSVFGLIGFIIAGCGQTTAKTIATPRPTTSPTAQSAPTATPASTTTTKATPPPASSGAQSYSAAIPGPGCDTGAGRWKALPSAIVRCGTASLQLGNAVGSNYGAVEFDGPPSWGTFPTNYQVSIDAVVTDSAVGVGFKVRNSAKGGYNISVAGSGTFSTFGGAILDTQSPAAQPPVNTTYHIVVKLVGSRITVTVNGQVRGNYTDATFPTGTSLLLVANASTSGTTGYVTIKNLLITVLA